VIAGDIESLSPTIRAEDGQMCGRNRRYATMVKTRATVESFTLIGRQRARQRLDETRVTLGHEPIRRQSQPATRAQLRGVHAADDNPLEGHCDHKQKTKPNAHREPWRSHISRRVFPTAGVPREIP